LSAEGLKDSLEAKNAPVEEDEITGKGITVVGTTTGSREGEEGCDDGIKLG